jgi:hypothetical protein
MESSRHAKQPSKNVTGARAAAQRNKLDAQAERRRAAEQQRTQQPAKAAEGKQKQAPLLARRRASTTVERTVADYLLDHEGGNSSPKTLQWHQTALGLLREFLEKERGITLVGEVDAPDITAWFAYLRKTPGSRGKVRSERTIQTYARSARAYFHWLVRRETIARNPFERVSFPKVGKPLIRTIEPEEFERRLVACTPPGEVGPLADRAAARNRAILWLLYDTGIRLSELCGLRTADFDRKHGLQSFVIDPDFEYQHLCEALGGTVIRLAPGSVQRLNPFDLLPPRCDFHTYLATASRGDRLAEKILDLHAMLDILLAEDASPAVPGSGMLSKREKGLLDRALYEAYLQEGTPAIRVPTTGTHRCCAISTTF